MDNETQRLRHQLASCQSRLLRAEKRHERYRQRMEQKTEELSRAKRVFETTLEALPSGILVIDHTMNVLLINNALREMFGVKDEPVMGRKCYSVMLNSSFPCKGVSCRRVIQTESPISEELVIFVEGEKRLFEVKTLPWRSEDSRGVVRTFTDVTHVRMAEQYRILAGISSYMAHTVRNSLMPMGGFLKLLEDHPLNEEQKLYLSYIYRSLFSLEDAVSEYTYYIKLKKGISYGETIDLPKEVQRTAIMFAKGEVPQEHRMGEIFSNVSVNWSIHPQASFVVRGDPEVFQKGLLFLLKAASELAMERGETHPLLQVDANPTLEGWELSLLIPGLSIEDSLIHSILEPWMAPSPKDAFPHWGVAIFNETVAGHGGRLTVANTPKGLVFSALFKP